MPHNMETCPMGRRPDWDEELSAWLDGEQGPARDAELRDHVGSCAACGARVEALRRVDARLAATPLPAVSEGLHARLAGRLEPAAEAGPARWAPPQRQRWLSAPVAGLALAAAAAVAVYLAVGGGRTPVAPPSGAPTLAQTPPDTPALSTELRSASDEELAVAFELETVEDLPLIANLEVLERLLALDEGRG